MKSKIKIPAIIAENFTYKLFAVILGTIIWFFVSQQVKSENATYTVPAVVSYEQDKMIVEPRIFNLQVVLRGSRGSLDRLSSQDIEVNLNLPLLDQGISTYELRISRSQVQTPSGIEVEEVRPSSITLQVDRIVSRAVPVRIREQGSLRAGYQVQERRALPSTVRITGPSRLLEDLNEVVTEPIVLGEGTVQSFQQQNVRLVIPGDIQANPARVHVSYEISRHTALESFNQLPVRVLSDVETALRVGSRLDQVSVTLRGPQNLIEEMAPHKIQPFIDLTAITSPGQYSRPVHVWLADPRVLVEYLHPQELQVTLVDDQAAEAVASPVEESSTEPGAQPENGTDPAGDDQ